MSCTQEIEPNWAIELRNKLSILGTKIDNINVSVDGFGSYYNSHKLPIVFPPANRMRQHFVITSHSVAGANKRFVGYY